MKIYKNVKTKKAWLNVPTISQGEKTAGRRVTKRLNVNYDSIKDIVSDDWVGSKGVHEGDVYYLPVNVPIKLEEEREEVVTPGVYDSNGNVIIAPVTVTKKAKIYNVIWDVKTPKGETEE